MLPAKRALPTALPAACAPPAYTGTQSVVRAMLMLRDRSLTQSEVTGAILFEHIQNIMLWGPHLRREVDPSGVDINRRHEQGPLWLLLLPLRPELDVHLRRPHRRQGLLAFRQNGGRAHGRRCRGRRGEVHRRRAGLHGLKGAQSEVVRAI